MLGVDIGGSGIKAAVVDTKAGVFVGERHRIPTPQPATPKAISRTVGQLVDHFEWKGSVGIGVSDPVERLQAIIASTKRAKRQLEGMPRSTILQYTALLLAPLSVQLATGIAGRVRPAFNVVVSNVPGPQEPLYFRGARLEAAYPLSIPFPGYGLNITLNSYAGTLNFGFIGCRDALPHLQRLAVYAGEALEELEATHLP